MGYTHHWYRQKEIDKGVFSAIVKDFRKLLPVLEKEGVKLAGSMGEGEPEITDDFVCFNGSRYCGHKKDEAVVIPWPTETAGGIAKNETENVKAGHWFAGVLLEKRTCNGDCSYEDFVFERMYEPTGWERPKEGGLYFSCCKTAFRPYDLAVTAFLVIAKHYLEDNIRVVSDGREAHWFDGKMLCQQELGYGLEYVMAKGGLKKHSKE
ncbi:MAG: hypothetical protein ACK4WF_03315 [Candidatus Brocadiales bacterium]